MLNAKFGRSSMQVSKIILGTWQAGKDMWADIDDRETKQAIYGALECGITMIDTAAIYGNGYSEQIIAQALHAVPRETYQLATKVFSNKLRYDQVLAECEKSLRNLKTEFIDLYQIHWPSGAFNSEVVPIAETMEALNKLQASGKILNIGVSNFSSAQLIEATQYGNIVSNQAPYSLIWRQYEQDVNAYCRTNGLAIMAYSPLAQGVLTGKFKQDHVFKPGDHRQNNKFMHAEVFPHVARVLAGLQSYAEKYSTSVGNIALNWLISQPNTFAIVGCRNLTQVQDTVKSCSFQLSAVELAEIDKLSDFVTKNMDQTGTLWGTS